MRAPRLQRAPGDAANPFFEENDPSATLGMDVKYGVTGNLTLDMTVNPDFGQVEADPAQVNLSAFETFFPERRPFFPEGANIFNYVIAMGGGGKAKETLFYSRRIGRAPQGWVDPRGGYVEEPDNTTIQVAEKLSGKTESGWTKGMSASLDVGKMGGGFWMYGAGIRSRDPEFEVNDMGYMRSTDFLMTWAWLA